MDLDIQVHFLSLPKNNLKLVPFYNQWQIIANGNVVHRALLLEAQQSINNNLNHIIVQNLTYRGRQGGTISEVVLDPSDIYEG